MKSSLPTKCLSVVLSCVLVMGLSPMTASAIQDAIGGSRLQAGNLAQTTDNAGSEEAVDSADESAVNEGVSDEGASKVVSPLRSAIRTIKANVAKSPNEGAQELVLDTPAEVTISEDNDYEQWFAYTPATSGQYLFESSMPSEGYTGDPYGYLYEMDEDGELQQIASDDDSAAGLNFRLAASNSLEEGTTYYLLCTSSGRSDASYQVQALRMDVFDLSQFTPANLYYNGGIWADEPDVFAAMNLSIAGYEDEDEDGSPDNLIYGEDYEFEGWYDYTYDEQTGESALTKLDGAPTESGTYYARIKGVGSYKNTLDISVWFYDPAFLGNYNIRPAEYPLIDDGGVVTADKLNLVFSRQMSDGERTLDLECDSDYELTSWMTQDGESLEEVMGPGDYSVCVSGINNYTGEVWVNFTVISARDIAYAQIVGEKDQYVYHGEPLTVGFTVTAPDGAVLEESTHYTKALKKLSEESSEYEDADAIDSPGQYRYEIQATGVDGYTGSSVYDFYVEGYSWSYADTYAYRIDNLPALELGTSQEVSIDEESKPVQWFTFTPSESGEYLFESESGGDPYACLYGAADPDDESAQGYDLVILNESDDADGSRDFKVRSELEAGTTYYLACGAYDNLAYQVTARLFDIYDLSQGYIESQASAFREGESIAIEDFDLEICNANGSYLREGRAYKFEGWYTAQGVALDVAPSTAGDYIMRVQGIDPYYGTLDVPFAIASNTDLTYASVSDVADSYNWRGHVITIAPVVTDSEGNKLNQGADYSLAFEKYDDEADEYVGTEEVDSVGKYRLIISQGTSGTYTGSKTVEFDVEEYIWNRSDAYADIPESAMVLDIGSPVNVELNEDNNGVRWLAFTPSESGKYVFTSSGCSEDPYGRLYAPLAQGETNEDGFTLKSIAYNDDGDVSYDFEIVASGLVAGVTYYLACTDYETEDSYQVTVEKFDSNDLSNADLDWDTKNLWLGDQPSPARFGITLSVKPESGEGPDKILVEGEDYQVEGWYDEDGERLDAVPTAGGYYALALEGIAPYHGTKRLWFTIKDPHDLSGNWWYLQADDVYAGTSVDGSALNLRFVFDDDYPGVLTTPTLGDDFDVVAWCESDTEEWSQMPPSEPGWYEVKVEGKANGFYGTATTEFRVRDASQLSEYKSSHNSPLWANGEPMTLDRLGVLLFPYGNPDAALEYGVDYRFVGWYDYDSDKLLADDPDQGPTQAGEYYAEFEAVEKDASDGALHLSGTTTVYFDISDPYDIEYYNFGSIKPVGYDGQPLTPEKLGLSLSALAEDGSRMDLVYGQDYKVVKWEKTNGTYDDDESWAEEQEASGTDLSEITEIGYYELTLKGISPYKGTEWLGFRIVDSNDLSFARIEGVNDQYYLDDDLNIVPEVYTAGGAKLALGTDFNYNIQKLNESTGAYATVERITEAGSYQVEVQAIEQLFGGYTGSVTKQFTVVERDTRVSLEDGGYVIEGIADSYDYTGSAIEPRPTVKSTDSYGDVLVENQDYTVSYVGNVEIGTATVTVTGMGGYIGSLSTTFQIKQAEGPNPDDPKTPEEELAEAQAAYDALVAQEAADQAAVEAAQAAYDEAVAAREAAESTLAEKQGALADAQEAAENAQSALESAQADQAAKAAAVDAKDAAITAAQNKVTAAQQAKQEADNAVAASQADVDEAQAALEAAQEQIAKGSFGFFEQMGSQAALNALNRAGTNNLGATLSNTDDEGKTFTSYVHQGEEADATSLENMKATIQWMKRANELRAGEDIFTSCNSVPLKVSDTLMAMAQADADWSDSHIGHADQHGGNYNVGENVAWNFGSDPFLQWYDEEKLVYRELQANADLNGDGYIGDRDGNNTTGHYTGLVNANYQSTGFAICARGTMYPLTYCQTFGRASYNGEATYTVDEYETRFMNYYNSVKGEPEAALAAAQEALEEAQANQTAKASAVTAAQAELEAAQSAKTQAQAELVAANEAVTAAEQAVADAQAAADAAQDAVDAAQGDVTAALAVEQQKKDALDAAKAALAQTQAQLVVAQQALEAAQQKCDYDLSLATVTTPQDFTYDGAAHALAAIVKARSGQALVEGKDYTVSYDDNVNAGEVTATITGVSPYQGSIQAKFRINPAEISGAKVDKIAAQTYTGVALEPAISVTFNGRELTAGADYDVTYARNINAGTATATIVGHRNFRETKVVEFEIAKAQLTATYVGETIEYNGTPAGEVDVMGFVNGETAKTASAYVAPTVTLPNQIEAGASYDLTPAGGSASNYTFTYVAGKLTVNPKPEQVKQLEAAQQKAEDDLAAAQEAQAAADRAKAEADAAQSAATASLAAAEQAQSAGAANAVALAEKAAADSAAAQQKAQAYLTLAQKAQQASSQAQQSAQALKDAINANPAYATADMQHAAEEAIASSTAQASVANDAVNNATSAVSDADKTASSAKQCADNAKSSDAKTNLAKATVTVAAQTYTGKSLTPSPTVKLSGKTLRAGTDYSVAYANNLNAGTATVTVTGKNGYVGSKSATFKINPAAGSIAFKAKKKVLTIKLGKSLKASKAYKVTSNLSGGKVTYKKVKGSKKITVASNGKIKLAKKGLKKGKTYTIQVKATSAAKGNYKEATSKTVKIKIKVK